MFSIVLGLFVLGIVVFLIASKNKKAKQLREAEAEYKAALTALQQGNTSANRVRVLELGRHYVSLCREGVRRPCLMKLHFKTTSKPTVEIDLESPTNPVSFI